MVRVKLCHQASSIVQQHLNLKLVMDAEGKDGLKLIKEETMELDKRELDRYLTTNPYWV